MGSDARFLWESAGGSAPAEWDFCTLEDLLLTAKSISVGVMYPGNNVEDGIPLVRVGDVANGMVVKRPDFCIAPTVDEEYKRTRLSGDEVLLTLVGEPGDCVIVTEEMRGWNAARALAVLKLKDPEIRYWLRMILLSGPSKHIIDSRLNTTVQRTLNLKDVRQLPIPLPAKTIRDGLCEIARSIELKITLNRQLNQTLEQMAQALFKSWFVDFDPVIDNALAAGNVIPDELQERADRRRQQLNQPNHKPLPDDVRKLFPSEFELTENLGWVPLGWGVKSISDLVDTISKTYPLKSVDKVIFLNTGDIEAGLFLHENYSDTGSLPGQAKKSIQQDDILYSEIRPKNKRFAYVNFDGSNHVVSTKLMVLRAKPEIDPKFIYFVLTRDACLDKLQRIAELRSGTFPQITFDELSLIELPVPDNKKILNMFSELILDNFYEKQFQLQSQSTELAKLRDTLLPKLISGELRIPEAQQQVEAVLE